MSPFLTFAICLSIAYLLYYGANIGKDLYAAGKQHASNEEVFEPEKESEKEETAETEKRIASLQENLDEADVTSEYGIKAPELHELLEGKKASLFKPQINVIRNVL